MDGIDALPDQNITAGKYRDELACVGVQHEANDEHHRHETADRGDQGIKGPFLPNKTNKTGTWRHSQFVLGLEIIPR